MRKATEVISYCRNFQEMTCCRSFPAGITLIKILQRKYTNEEKCFHRKCSFPVQGKLPLLCVNPCLVQLFLYKLYLLLNVPLCKMADHFVSVIFCQRPSISLYYSNQRKGILTVPKVKCIHKKGSSKRTDVLFLPLTPCSGLNDRSPHPHL